METFVIKRFQKAKSIEAIWELLAQHTNTGYTKVCVKYAES